MGKLRRLFIGVATDPQLVAAFRALVLYGLPLGAAFVIGLLNGVSDPKWVGLALGAAAFIRVLEGALDRALKSQMNNIDPPPVAGSGDTNILK